MILVLSAFVFLAIYLSFYLKIIPFVTKSSEGFPLLHLVPGSAGFKRIKIFSLNIPFLDGAYALYQVHKHGMNFVSYYARSVPLEGAVEMFLGPLSLYVSGDALVSTKILNSTEPGHLSRPALVGDLAPFLKKGLLCTPYEIWTGQRKIIARAFTFRCIRSYMAMMDRHGKALVKKLVDIGTKNDGVIQGQELHDALHSTVLQITLEFIMGSSIGSSYCGDVSDYTRNLFELRDIMYYHFFHLECHIPMIWRFHPMRRKASILQERMLNFVGKVITHFKSNSTTQNNKSADNTTSDEQRCLVEEMAKYGASAEEIYNEISTFLGVGYETVTSALNILLHHLACHQKLQTNCRDEVDNILGTAYSGFDNDKDDYYLDLEKIHSLDYLDRFISESLRICPTAPFTARELKTSLKIDETLTLKEGRLLLTSPWLIHHNPKYYPRPEIFDPDRFLPAEIKKREPGAYIPFLAGNRNCIGRRVAMLQLKTLSAWILRNFELDTRDELNEVKLLCNATVTPERLFRTSLKLRKKK